jgi:hypothetical protein
MLSRTCIPRLWAFGSKREEVIGEWRKLHNEELHDLHSSPNNVRAIKSERMRWAGKVMRMGKTRGVYRVFVANPEGNRPLGRPRSRWIFRKWDVGLWTGSSWRGIGTGGGHL